MRHATQQNKAEYKYTQYDNKNLPNFVKPLMAGLIMLSVVMPSESGVMFAGKAT